MRNLILTTILVCLFHTWLSSQCNTPAAPGTTCSSAIAFCDNELDGFCSTTYASGVGTPVNMPPFCGSVQNNLWLQFVAGSNNIVLEFTVENCINGDGLQAMVLHSDDCTNFTGISDCYTASTSGGSATTTVFQLSSANYTIGETYYVMIDGWLGDYCDFSIDVIQGTTGIDPLDTPLAPSGMTTVCPGANTISYSINPVPNAVGYNWYLPPGASFTTSADELSITVDYSNAASSGNICVEAFNDCDISDQGCLPITIQNLPPVTDVGYYCAGGTFFYNGNNTNYTEGSYYITLSGASYLGCDSIVNLEVIENDIKETFLVETICQGELVEVGGIFFNQTNPNIAVTLTSHQNCDSIVYLDLTVLDPQAVILPTDDLTCNNPDVLLNASLSNADTYTWSTTDGNILSGQGTPLLTVDAGGTYSLTVNSSHLGETCTHTSEIIVNESYIIPQLLVNTTDLMCGGTNDGTATAVVSGGVPPYQYYWSNGATTPTVENLSMGAYSLTVTGANGCDVIEFFGIIEPNPMSYNINLGNVSCSGLADGTAFVNVSGGTGPYSYQWSNGANGIGMNFQTGLAAGNYDLTITDANGCTLAESFIINQPDVIVLSIDEVQPDCQGELGIATVMASGGSGNLSFLWSGTSQNTATVNNLSPGNYTVTVTDVNGCTESISTEIFAAEEITLSVSVNDPFCHNGSEGTATVMASGGAGGWTYEWNTNPPAFDSSINDLEAGTYEVTVTDINGCTQSTVVNLQNPDDLQVTINQQDVLCFGVADGSASVIVSGGTEPYNYAWDDISNQTTATAQNLTAGVYTVTITDANLCQKEIAVIIDEPSASIEIISTSSPSTCGANNGAIDLTVTGGTSPYTFDWTNNIPAVEDPSGLGAGTYSVVVTDFNGCSVSSEIVVNTPTGLEAQLNIMDASCNGSSNGSIDLNVTGGLAPYVFEWSNSVNNGNEDFFDIPAGMYSVTVSDSDGCSVVASGIVGEAAELTGSMDVTNASCGGTDGSINIIVNGGTAPYNFDWSDSAYDGLQNANGLIPGYYSVLITDANGCSLSLATDIIIPDGPMLNINGTDASCNGENSGSIDLTVAGGAAPYSFQWNNGLNSTEDHSNLVAGTYSVTVTDANDCSAVTSYTIDEPLAFSVNLDTDHVSCSGGNDGSVVALVNGGLAPYSYLWENNQTSYIATSLAAGSISVTVTDANNCSVSVTTLLNEPQPINALYTIDPPSCAGVQDAAIDMVVSGGTGALDFSWSNGNNTEDQTNLMAGLYSVTITDALNCSQIIDNIEINDPAPITLSANATMADCNTANGALDLNVNGGNGGYTFSWSNGATLEDIFDLPAGNYTVTVTDSNACTLSNTFEIESPSGLSLIAQSTDLSCFAADDGAIEVSIVGGTAPFTYQWDNTSQQTEDIQNLAAGTYALTVTDANNCSATVSSVINSPIAIQSLIASSEATCGAANGSIGLAVSGGTAPYAYNWSNGAGVEDPTTLFAGYYDVTITDANGCTATNGIAVETPDELTAQAIPNNVLCSGTNTGSINLEISGGVPPYQFNWDNGIGAVQNPSNLYAGQYTLTITDDNACTTTLSIEVLDALPMEASFTTAYESCNTANGAIDMTVTGGTPPYTYQWQDGIGNMEDPDGLSVGTYWVTVTDANNCTFITNTEVLSPPPFFINDISTALACNADTDASIDLNVEGGVPPYTYAWNSGQNTEDISALGAGLYSVVVTDAEGCTISHTVEIEEPPLLEVFLIQPIELSCNGSSDAAIVLEVIGGNPDYSFNWSDDALDGIQNPSGLSAGQYTLTVTDANACTTIFNTNITEPEVLQVEANITPVSCFDEANGSIDIEISGGTMPYDIDWNNGFSDLEDIFNLSADQYMLQITDDNGCIINTSFELENPESIQVAIDEISDYNGYNISCFDENDGYVKLSAIGGQLPYAFAWENGAVGDYRENLSSGIYPLIVSDANGCSVEYSLNIQSPEAIVPEIETIKPTCHDENDGLIIINNVSGGTEPYLYNFENAYWSIDNSYQSLTAGIYNVGIQDANGCEWETLTEVERPEEFIVDLPRELSLTLGDSLQLNPLVNVPLSEIDTFIWQSSTEISVLNPFVSPVEPAAYHIWMINDKGCEARASVRVLVEKERLVYVPNVFTPNNDGINDLFFPQFGKGVEHINAFRIYDRWGSLLFEKMNYLPGDNTSGWNGHFRNKAMGNGVYIYYMEVVFQDGRVENYKGDFTLFR